MSRPTLEVADILRASGSSFLERHGSHLAPQHRKVMDAIAWSASRMTASPSDGRITQLGASRRS